MRFQDAFFTTQGERKRQRTPNSRFQKDYVALPGLRTAAKSSWEQRSPKEKWSHGEGFLTNECTGLTVDVERKLLVRVRLFTCNFFLPAGSTSILNDAHSFPRLKNQKNYIREWLIWGWMDVNFCVLVDHKPVIGECCDWLDKIFDWTSWHYRMD